MKNPRIGGPTSCRSTPGGFPVQVLVLAVLVNAVAVAGAETSTVNDAFEDHRGIWISRFEYGSLASINNVIDRSVAAGFNEVFFQVRGQGDTLYDSNVEVWDASYGPSGPGFDPLQTAIDRAALHGVEVHAWLNTMPMWSRSVNGGGPPSNPDHLYNQNPDWRLKDFNGVDQPISTGSPYVGINPTRAGARQHLADIANDIVSRYDVAGVHMDYIRNTNDSSGSALVYPTDATTRAQYTSETGNSFTSGASPAYKQWIADNITKIVQEVDAASKAANPNARTTAAVWRDYEIGYNSYQQQADLWAEQGYLDTNLPMIYTQDMALYRNNLLKQVSLDHQSGMQIGIGSYLHDAASTTMDQLQLAQAHGANGYTIFSYSTIYSGSSLTPIGQAVQTFNQDLIDRQQAGHLGMALTNFEGSEGYFTTSPNVSGSNVNIASATAALTEDEAYEGTQAQEIVVNPSDGSWFLRHLAGLGSPINNLDLISEGYVGFWALTVDEGLSVRLTVDDVEGTGERGMEQDLIADGEWHLYEWNLGDDEDWEGWVNGDGLIEGDTVTLDSIQFFGTSNKTATILIDNVSFNPLGSLSIPEPGTLAMLVPMAMAVQRRRRR